VCRGYVASVCSGSTSTTSCTVTTRLHPQWLYINDAVRCEYSSPGRSGFTSTTPRIRVHRLLAWLVVDYFTYVTRLGASARRVARRRLLRLHRASGCLGTSRGLSSTTSRTPRVRVPRHVTRLVVDYFAHAAQPGASARRAARRAARRQLLRVRRASGCLGTSRGSSSTTSPTPRD
jgi:hypothetical protein